MGLFKMEFVATAVQVKPIWILLKQETVSGSGISWAICKSAPRSRQITTPAPHHSFAVNEASGNRQPCVWLSRSYNGSGNITLSQRNSIGVSFDGDQLSAGCKSTKLHGKWITTPFGKSLVRSARRQNQCPERYGHVADSNKVSPRWRQNVQRLRSEWVSECMDLYPYYSAQSLRTPNALDALVMREQVRFR